MILVLCVDLNGISLRQSVQPLCAGTIHRCCWINHASYSVNPFLSCRSFSRLCSEGQTSLISLFNYSRAAEYQTASSSCCSSSFHTLENHINNISLQRCSVWESAQTAGRPQTLINAITKETAQLHFPHRGVRFTCAHIYLSGALGILQHVHKYFHCVLIFSARRII